MRLKMSYVLNLIVVLTAVGISSCGKKTKSSDVTITVQPSQPIVFTSDFSYQNGASVVKVKAPWFKVGVSLYNQTDSSITVIALRVEVTSIDSAGRVQTNKLDIDPTTANFTQTTGGVTITCNYSDFGQFDPKGTKAGPTSFNDVSLFSAPNSSSTPLQCPTISPIFYIGGNPIEPNQTTFSYRVKISPIGWFGTRLSPQDRYQESFNFTTQ